MARSFRQKKHVRISKKGKAFTAGQSAAFGVGVYAGLRVAGRIGGRLGERALAHAAGRSLRSAVGRRRQFITRFMHTRPTLKKALGKATISGLSKTEAAIIRFARKNLPK